MPRYVLILDPTVHHRAAFTITAKAVLPNHELVIVDSTAALNDHLSQHIHETELLSIDYVRTPDAIDTLLSLPPIAPVILHVPNDPYAGSDRALYPQHVASRLSATGWPTTLLPGSRTDAWIRRAWGPAVWKLC